VRECGFFSLAGALFEGGAGEGVEVGVPVGEVEWLLFLLIAIQNS